MSTTIDQKVVEMRFDNRNFEKNVATTMSTLDRFKQKLKFSESSKGLENIQRSASKLSFNSAEASLAALEKRFSTTGIIGMTVIQNLTNSAMTMAKKLSSSVIDSILGGGKRRATNLENARFQLEGLLKDAGKVEGVMKNVSDAVDGTAYSLDAAANVASQLAASGMEAGDQMFKSLRGVAGVAAMTNSSYEDIGRIYTQVAGQGRLMGDQLLQLSGRGMNAAATLAKYLNTTEAEVRDMTSKGKIDFATFADAMDDAFGEHAKAANNTVNGAIANIKSALARIGALFYEPLIKQKGPLVQFLNEVRVAINGVKKSMEPIAEEITTKINKALLRATEIFKKFVAVLNWSPLVKFKDTLKGMSDTLKGTLKPINAVKDSLDKVKHTVEDYNKLVDKIIRGDFKNAPVRYQLLAEAGYDWAYAQNLVNERLGSSVRHATDFNPAAEQMTKNTENMVESGEDLVETLTKLSKDELIAKGYTEEQADAIKALGDVSKKTGISVKDLLNLLDKDQFDAKFLIFDSFKNVGMGLVTVLKSIGSALMQVFSVKSESLFDIVAAIHKFTQLFNDEIQRNAEGLTNTLKGLFSIIHLITSIIGGGFKLALKLLNAVLGAFNMNVIDLTGNIGELVFKFEQWLTKESGIVKVLQIFIDLVGKGAKKVKEFVDNNKQIQAVLSFVKDAFKNAGKAISDWFNNFPKDWKDIPKYIFEGLINGIKNNGPKVISVLGNFVTGLVEFVKNLLGIRSPSTVFFDIGKNIIAGLVNGLKAFVNGVFDVLGSIADGAMNIFNKIDWGKILAVGLAVGLLYLAKQLLGILKLFGNAVNNLLSGIGSFMSGIGSWAADTGAAKKINAQANLWKAIGQSILMIAGAMLLIAQIPKEDLLRSAIVVAAITGVVAGLMILASKLEKDKMINIKVGISPILAACLGLFLISKALAKLAGVNPLNLAVAVRTFTILLGELMGMLLLMADLMSIDGMNNIDKAGKMFAKLGTTVLILAIAMRILGKMNPDALSQGLFVLTLLFGLINGLIFISLFAGDAADKAGKMLWRVGVALLIMVTVMKIIGRMKPETIVKGLVVLDLLAAYITALIAISYFSGENALKAGRMILMIGSALLLIAVAMKIVASIDVNGIAKGLIVMSVLTALIDSMIYISKYSGQNALRAGALIMAAATALLLMTAALFLISKMDPKQVYKALPIITVLVALVDSMIYVTKYTQGVNKNALGPLIMITVMFSLLIAAVIGLTFVDQEKLRSASACVSIVVGTLGLLIASINKLKVEKGAIKTLLSLTLVVGILAIIIGLLAHLAPEGAIGAAVSLGILLISMASCVLILNKIGRTTKGIQTGIGAMYALIGVVALLAAILNLLHGLDPVASIGNVIALSILLGVMAGVVVILGKFGGGANTLKGVGAIALIGLVVLGLASILLMLDRINPDKAIQNVIALSIFLGVLSIMLVALNGIGLLSTELGDVITAGIVALYALLPALFVLTDVLTSLDKINPSSSIPNAEALSILLGAMSLSLIALSVAGMLASGAALGIVALLALTKLMPGIIDILKMMEKANLQNGLRNALTLSILLNAFSRVLVILAMVGMTGPAAYNGIKALTTLIVAMGGLMLAIGALSKYMPKMEEFINKGIDILCQVAYGIGKFIGSFVGGITAGIVSGLPEIGLRLSQFMMLAMPFIQGAKQVDKKTLTGIAILTRSIITLCAAELITGVTKFLTMGGTFADLGTQLSMFMLNATPFIMGLRMISPELAKAAKNMAETVLILTAADMVQGLSRFLGLSNKDPFTNLSTQLSAFGQGMIEFYDKVKGIEDVDKFKTAAEGAKYLVEVAKSIPNEGGLLAGLAGDNTLEGFGKGIKSFGQAMIDFAESIAELDDDKIDKIKKSAKAGEAFTEMAKTIPNDGGLFSVFAGDNTLEGFSKGITEYGTALSGFGAKVANITPEQATAIEYSTKAGSALIKMTKNIEKEGGLGSIFTGNKSLANFSKNLTAFGEGIVSFSNTLANKKTGIDPKKMDDISVLMKGLSEAFKYMKDINDKDAKSFKDALNSLGKVSIDKLVAGFGNEADSKINSIKTTLKTFMNGAISAVKSYKPNFESAGQNVAKGFANGIKNGTYHATAAAKEMARLAKEAARKELDEASPSKEFFRIGAFAGEGFINALYAYADKAYNASEDMAGSAKDGFSRAIASVAKTIENGIDDDLTIRPVLDLSNVEEGARSIAGMLGSGQSIGTMANINAISTGINRNLQNRRSDEMLSAIKDLGKSLNNAGTTNNYNVNGVSYSGDEEISNAIETLVRAATVEGRV